MNRRDFVRRVVAGLAGTAVAAEFDLERLLWTPKPMVVVPALPAHAFTSIQWVTQEALRALNERLALLPLGTRAYVLVPSEGIGQGGITDMNWVKTDARIDDDFERTTLRPAMAALAQRVQEHRVTSFGRPQPYGWQQASESAVVTDPRNGVAVRGSRMYDVAEDLEMFQFDVLTRRS